MPRRLRRVVGTRGRIEDPRQLVLPEPLRVAWLRDEDGAVARTRLGILAVRRLRPKLRWYDGFIGGDCVAGGFSLAEAMEKTEAAARRRNGEEA